MLSSEAFAQLSPQELQAQEQQRKLDSVRTEQKRVLDSTRVARTRILDSMKVSRQHRIDSLAAIRAYRGSKRYKDSVASARQAQLDAIKQERALALDSMKAERKRILDSSLAVRKAIMDSTRAVQKRRTDSLAVIREYRSSKRFSDSVAVVRKLRMDSMKTERKEFNDSVALVRKNYNDSVSADRKARLDSTLAARKVFMDSLKAVRKARTDSLTLARAARDKLKKEKAKEKEQKMQLALEMKIKKKQEAWSNDKMLKKKWSVPRKVIQNTFTRYNYYFNAENKMNEALDNMQRFRKENYDAMLALFPFDPDRDSSVLAPDMDSIIQKASVGIQIHDPRTKWGDDLYLLLGQAYYYKGDYKNAAIAFQYIVSLKDKYAKKDNSRSSTSSRSRSKGGATIAEADENKLLDFLKHQTAHNQALLWLARTYTQSQQYDKAESVIDLLDADPNMPDALKGRLALEKAFLALQRNNQKDATGYLAMVANDKEQKDWIRMRAGFLNGQIQQQMGLHQEAAQSFTGVLEMNPKLEMDFYARRNMAYSQMEAGGNEEVAMASLKKVLKDGKYAPYYEQVYYIAGRLAAGKGDNQEAISYLNKSINTPRSTRKQKALSFAVLGNVYYNMHEYRPAKLSYDSSAIFAGPDRSDTLIAVAARRSAVLGFVTKPMDDIHEADSLLALAAMSGREQEAVVKRYIKGLEQAREDSIFKAENAGIQNAMRQQPGQAGNNTPATNWYFSNPTLMQQGYNDFKQKWGNRPLADNWRRGGSGFAGKAGGTTTTEYDEDSEYDENGIPTEKSLLAFIPNSAQKKSALNARSINAYMSMARAYYTQLEDYPQVYATLDQLDKRYPTHEHKAEGLYLRYSASIKQNNTDNAQQYSAALRKQYADSKWAKLVRPTEDGAGMASGSVSGVADFYDESYKLLIRRQYSEVLQRMQMAHSKYNDKAYKKRFDIMEAIALVGTGEYDKADTMLNTFLRTYPTDSLKIWAETTLGYIKRNRPATPPPSAMPPAADSSQAAIKANANGTDNKVAMEVSPLTPPPAPKVPPKTYAYRPGDDHYVIFSFPSMEKRAMGVKAAMGDFNRFRFGGQDLSTDIHRLTDAQGIIVTESFKGAARAKVYMNSLNSTKQIFREYKTGEYNVFIISADNYQKMLADKSVEEYLKFYGAHYR